MQMQSKMRPSADVPRDKGRIQILLLTMNCNYDFTELTYLDLRGHNNITKVILCCPHNV